jgi:hypothetical protein
MSDPQRIALVGEATCQTVGEAKTPILAVPHRVENPNWALAFLSWFSWCSPASIAGTQQFSPLGVSDSPWGGYVP